MELMARNIVKRQSTCLASTENKILIDIGSAKSVNLQDVIITQVADASAQCELGLKITDADVKSAVSSVLDDANMPKGLIDEIVAEMKVDGSGASSVSKLVSSCVASSVNDFRVEVGRVGGSVAIMDLSLEQIATARVAQCLDNVYANDMPLRQVLAEKLPAQQQLAPDAPCGSVQTMYTAGYIVLGGTGGLILALLLVCWLLMRTK